MTSKVGSKEDPPTTSVNKQVLVPTSPVSSLLELEDKSLFHPNSTLWILSSPTRLCTPVFCMLRILDKAPYSVLPGRKHTIPCVLEQLLRNSLYLRHLRESRQRWVPPGLKLSLHLPQKTPASYENNHYRPWSYTFWKMGKLLDNLEF